MMLLDSPLLLLCATPAAGGTLPTPADIALLFLELLSERENRTGEIVGFER